MAGSWRLTRRAVCLALCGALLGSTTAMAWSTRPTDEFDTHDWLAHQSARAAARQGYAGVDVARMVDGSESVVPAGGRDVLCDASAPGHADAAGQVANLVEQAAAAYAVGDTGEASALSGRISHLLADLGDPAFAAGWSAADAATVWWRQAALNRTDAAFEYNGWITRREPVYVEDPLQWAQDLRAQAASDATVVASLAADGREETLALRQVLARRLDEVVFRTSSLLATMQARAHPGAATVKRLAGLTRYETAVAIAREAYPDGYGAVILVNGEAWSDGIAATSLCALLNAPILFTGTAAIPEATLAELARTDPHSVTIVGGSGVVSEEIAQSLRARGHVVTRLAGLDRYETSDRIAAHARTLDPDSGRTAYVCTGADFADALSISQVTARTGNIVLLARPGAASREIVERARAAGVRSAVLVGGTGAVSTGAENALKVSLGASAVTRLQGIDRYATAAAVLDLRDKLFPEPITTITLASGVSFPDGLAGGVIAGREGHALLLSRAERLPEAAVLPIRTRADTIRGLIMLGGSGVLGGFLGLDVQRALHPDLGTAPGGPSWEPTVTVSYSPAQDLHGPLLGRYYIDQSPTYRDGLSRPTDAEGIVMVRYPDLPAPVYNPVTVAQHAIGACDEHLQTGSETAKADFLRHADWLRDEGMDAEGRFAYRWNYAPRALSAPWYSAMAQGEGISALLRAYQLAGDESYLAAARRAFVPFTKTTADGGVTTVAGEDLWLEEYVEAQPKQVLNGHIFAMWGLWDLYRVTGDAAVRGLFERSCTTLLRHLGDYEYNGYVLYERAPAHYCYSYYWLQIQQLRVLTGITGDMRYADRGDAWALMKSDPNSIGSLALGAAREAAWLAPRMAEPIPD